MKPSERRKDACFVGGLLEGEEVTDAILDEHHERLERLEMQAKLTEKPVYSRRNLQRDRDEALARADELEATVRDREQGQAALDLLFSELDMQKEETTGDEEMVRSVVAKYREVLARSEKAERQLVNLVDDIQRNGAAHYLEDILSRHGIPDASGQLSHLRHGFQEMRVRAEKAEAERDEVKKHADATIGALTDANNISCGTYAAMADGVRELTRERDETVARADDWKREFTRSSLKLGVHRARAEASERRADDYQQRFEVLRGEVQRWLDRATGSVVHIDSYLMSQLLARHPMPKGER